MTEFTQADSNNEECNKTAGLNGPDSKKGLAIRSVSRGPRDIGAAATAAAVTSREIALGTVRVRRSEYDSKSCEVWGNPSEGTNRPNPAFSHTYGRLH